MPATCEDVADEALTERQRELLVRSATYGERLSPEDRAFVNALAAFKRAAADLSDAWSRMPADAISADNYGLPTSFDEIVAVVSGWTIDL